MNSRVYLTLYASHSHSYDKLAVTCTVYYVFYRQDEKVNNLVAICFSVNCFPTISAWEHTFAPREYLVSNLEDLFMK